MLTNYWEQTHLCNLCVDTRWLAHVLRNRPDGSGGLLQVGGPLADALWRQGFGVALLTLYLFVGGKQKKETKITISTRKKHEYSMPSSSRVHRTETHTVLRVQPHPFANLAQVPLFPAPSATHPGAALGRLGCSPDQSAKYAGRLAFTRTIAAGRQGRAFVKPFYAQANAPLRGFDMSPALLNAASWWTKFLDLGLKPTVCLAVGHTTRETVWAWTDASGEDPCLGVVVYARGSWYYTYLDAPPAVFDQLLHRQDSQINFLEMLAVLLFVTTFQNIICFTAAFVFIDTTAS